MPFLLLIFLILLNLPSSSPLSSTPPTTWLSATSSTPESWADEQQRPIVNRGLEEAELMNNPIHKQSILAVSKLPARRKSRAPAAPPSPSTSPNSGFSPSTAFHPLAKKLRQTGVLRLPALLPLPLAASLRSSCLAAASSPDPDLSNVLLSHNRFDVRLQLSSSSPTPVTEALSVLLDSPLGDLLDSALGPSAVLHELACLISDPGSQRQVLHPDVSFTDDLSIITCFVALQPVSADMGPTVFLPGTHKAACFKELLDDKDERDGLIVSRPSALSLLDVGEASVFDGRILHAGTANQSKTRRAIFYFSFRSPAFNPGSSTNPGSLCEELQEGGGRTLAEVRAMVCAANSK